MCINEDGLGEKRLRVQSRLPCIPAEAASSPRWPRPPLLLPVCQLVQSWPSVSRGRRNKKVQRIWCLSWSVKNRGSVRFTAVWRRALAVFFFFSRRTKRERNFFEGWNSWLSWCSGYSWRASFLSAPLLLLFGVPLWSSFYVSSSLLIMIIQFIGRKKRTVIISS